MSGKAIEILTKTSEDFIAYHSLEKILVAYPLPDLFVTSMDSSGSSLGRDFVPALKNKCPIIALQDSWGASITTTWADKKFRPDFICVNDEIGAKIVLKAWPDFNTEKIIITGYPALDKYFDFDIKTVTENVKKKLNLTEQKPIIFYAGEVKNTGAILSELIAALNEIGKNVYFIPRQHPRMKDDGPEELPIWKKALTRFRAGTLISDSSACDTPSIIAASDVVLSMFSIVLVEAATLRKQNISILYPEVMNHYKEITGGLIKEFPLVSLGCCAKATNQKELQDLLLKGFNNELNLKANQEKHFKLDDKNTERIIKITDKLLT